jgi:exonuclease V
MKIGRRSENGIHMRENALLRLGKRRIGVKEIASQAWCEKQMELYALYGKEMTMQMQKGMQRHSEKQAEYFVELEAKPVTYPDRLYKDAYENRVSMRTLNEKGECSELKIWGSINGYGISGKIDAIKLCEGKARIVEYKTKKDAKGAMLGESDSVQARIYKKLLAELKNGDFSYPNFSKMYGLGDMRISESFRNELAGLGIEEGERSLDSIYKAMFDQMHMLPEIDEKLEVIYLERENLSELARYMIDYNGEELVERLKDYMEFWNGGREARPVPEKEKWKCNWCTFFNKKCFVWAG